MPAVPSQRSQYEAWARQAAQQYGVPVPIYLAQIDAESGWNPNAGSSAGAIGLAQFMPGTAQGLGIDPRDPRQALFGGAKYLSGFYKKYGRWDLALAAYNAGGGAVDKYGGIPPYAETQAYVQRIRDAVGGDFSKLAPLAPGSAPTSTTPGQPMAAPSLPNMPALQAPSSSSLASSLIANRRTPLQPVQATSVRAAAPLAAASTPSSEAAAGPAGPTPRLVPERSLPAAPAPLAFAGSDQRRQALIQRNTELRSAYMSQRAAASQGAQSPASAALSVVGAPATDPVTTYALEQQGVPYSWGGGTPSGPSEGFGRGKGIVGFDCSSLVQAAWAQVGVQIPRVTQDQIKTGIGVDPANSGQWKPGDLLFPHEGHVMMYIGGGKAIEAPYTGGHVRVVDASSRNYIAVRRPQKAA